MRVEPPWPPGSQQCECGAEPPQTQPRPQRVGRGLKGRGGAGPPRPVWKLLEVSQHRRPGSFRRACRQRVPSPAGAGARLAAGATPRCETPARPLEGLYSRHAHEAGSL